MQLVNHFQLKNILAFVAVRNCRECLEKRRNSNKLCNVFCCLQMKMAETSSRGGLGSDREWKSHHHNSKVVRKRFSIFPLHLLFCRCRLLFLHNFFSVDFFAHDRRQRRRCMESFRVFAMTKNEEERGEAGKKPFRLRPSAELATFSFEF
jgi:hypothetical protein